MNNRRNETRRWSDIDFMKTIILIIAGLFLLFSVIRGSYDYRVFVFIISLLSVAVLLPIISKCMDSLHLKRAKALVKGKVEKLKFSKDFYIPVYPKFLNDKEEHMNYFVSNELAKRADFIARKSDDDKEIYVFVRFFNEKEFVFLDNLDFYDFKRYYSKEKAH